MPGAISKSMTLVPPAMPASLSLRNCSLAALRVMGAMESTGSGSVKLRCWRMLPSPSVSSTGMVVFASMMPSRKSTSTRGAPSSAESTRTISRVASAHSCMRSRSWRARSRTRLSLTHRNMATTAAAVTRKAVRPSRRRSVSRERVTAAAACQVIL